MTDTMPSGNINWADDAATGDDNTSSKNLPPRTETDFDENGIKTIVEYRIDEQGKKIKVTRKIKRTLTTNKATPAMAQRHQWTKFGQEAGKKAGPTRARHRWEARACASSSPWAPTRSRRSRTRRTRLQRSKPSSGVKKSRAGCARATTSPRAARTRTRSALRTTRRAMQLAARGDDDLGAGGDGIGAATGAGAGGAGGKYVPPSMRAGARGGGETMNGPGNRDDLPTLRVTNLAEETEEEDLWGIFGRFQTRGRISRIYIGRDQEGLCRGFAFVSFEFKEDAEKAMAKVDGLPFSHLILSCTWSVPKEKA